MEDSTESVLVTEEVLIREEGTELHICKQPERKKVGRNLYTVTESNPSRS